MTRLAILASFLVLAGCASSPSGEPIVIGGAFNLTGGQASLDGPARRGAELAVRELEESGGLLGRPVRLAVRDGRTEPAAIAAATEALIERDGAVALVGFSDTDAVLAAGPAVRAAGLPFVSAGATSPELPAKAGPTVFLAAFGDDVQATAGAAYARDTLGAARVLVLWNEDAEYTRFLARSFREAWAARAGEDSIAGAVPWSAGRALPLDRLPRDADVLYVAALPDEVGGVVKALREAGFDRPIVGGDGFDTPELVRVAGPAAEGVHFTTHVFLDPDAEEGPVRDFIEVYRRAHGSAPEDAFAALGYDAVRLVADAIRRAGSTAPAAIVSALEATNDFPGVTGRVSYSPGRHVPAKSVTIVAVREGRFTRVAEIAPPAGR